jgi:hypothetical protein
MAAGQGSQAKFGIGTTSTVDQPYDFKSESLVCNEDFYDPGGIIGSREHLSERVRQNIRQIGGSVTLEPNSIELANLLPWILGAAGSGTTYALADTLPSRYVSVDRVTKVFVYSGCVVNRATFSASEGGPLTVSLDLIGVDETVNNSGTFPSLTISTAAGPYMLSDLAITVSGTTYNFREFSISIDNMLETRFLNSLTATAITPRDRQVSVGLRGPYGDQSALYGLAVAGVAVVATFTNSTLSTVFTMPAVQFPRRSPTVGGKSEIYLPLQGIARKSGSTASLTVTNDSTP